MTLSGFLRSSILAFALGSTASAALAAAAVAVGDGNFTHTSNNYDSVEEAKAAALQKCSAQAGNCEILLTTQGPAAIALAKGDNGMFASAELTPEAAQKAAMAGCRKSYRNCKFSALYWDEGGGWAGWAHAKGSDDTLVGNYFSYDNDSEANARRLAIEGCMKQQEGSKPTPCEVATKWGDWAYAQAASSTYTTVQLRPTMAAAVADAMRNCKAHAKPGDTCKITYKFVNTGSRKAPASFARVASLTEVARQSRQVRRQQVATQAVQDVTCTNRCVNGSCVRTFPNGRTENWQAPRVFDPLTNDWKWDTNSCGG